MSATGPAAASVRPDSPGARSAAPRHHPLIFESDRGRGFDPQIARGGLGRRPSGANLGAEELHAVSVEFKDFRVPKPGAKP